jgi:O-antigen/teichoic acid export membrane protein
MAAQAVVIEDAPAFASLKRSSEMVRGSWLRVLGTIALIVLFVGLPGPLIAFGFLVFARTPIIETVYPVLSALYVLVLFPLGFIASGLLYGDLCAVHARREEQDGN